MRLLLVVFLCLVPFLALGQGKTIYGIYERVVIPELGPYQISAKLDTGALTTSLGASDIKVFERDNTPWVSFKPQLRKVEDIKTLELPLARISKIKGSDNTAGERITRPVVVLNVCLSGKILPLEVNLTDRSSFNYPVLIGKKALISFNAIIDPSLKYQAGECNALLHSTP